MVQSKKSLELVRRLAAWIYLWGNLDVKEV